MFDQKSIYKYPLVQLRQRFKGDIPEHFQKMFSAQIWYYMNEDLIDKVVALRSYPYQNTIALKFLLKGRREYISAIIKDPELRILKRLWDCGNDGLNAGIKYYLIYSTSAVQQWVVKASHSTHAMEWFANINMDEHRG